MQLDSHLVERFHALHRQRLSGVLQGGGDGFSLGICLVEGEPVAIDLGIDLERAFAQSCRAYHKLDDAAAAELDAAIAGGAKARDYLVERQLVSEAEADQVAQAVVEDALTRTFRGPCSVVEFRQGVSPDELPIGVSALKMRIGVETLIRTCDQRVAEQIAVEREIGGWDAVFMLSEAEHVSGQLSEYEKMVLNFIDGRSSVQQIAELCRDSSMNLGRVLRSLLAKRIIARVDQQRTSGVRPAVGGGAPSGAHAAVRPASAVQPAAGPASAARPLQEMEIYRAPREPSRSPIVLVGLIALLAISLGVAFLVIQYNRKQERLRKDEAEIAQLLGERRWLQAREAIVRLRTEAGNDLGAIRTVEGLSGQVESAITAERGAVASLIDGEDFPAARVRIALLPDGDELSGRLRDAEAELRGSAAALAEEVRGRLANGDIAGALAAIDEVEGVRAAEAERSMATWRNDTLVVARSQTHPLHLRVGAIARLRQARPDAALQGQLAQLDADLQGQLRALSERLAAVEARAAAGAWREAQAEMDALRIGDAGSGTELDARAAQAAAAIKRASGELEGVEHAGLLALAGEDAAPELQAARDRIAAALQAYLQASGRDGLERLAGALSACAAGGARTIADRAAEAASLAAQVPPEDAALAAALQARVARLGGVEAEAATAFEEARRLGRLGDWKGSVDALEALVRQPAWRATAVRREAEIELESARSQAARRQQLKQDLRASMVKGDLAACEAIAREIGLAYLPLVVSSQPDGAEVVGADGTALGLTPLILDVTADERVDLRLTVRKAGYQPAEVAGVKAEGGWRLAVRLDRSAELALALGHPLTARPAVVDGRLWLADRSRVVSFERPAADAQRSALVGAVATLAEPVFAPVAAAGGELLLATREKLALRVGAEPLQRLPLPAASDRPVLAYRSPLVVDRDLLIVAARDGRLLAAQRGSAATLWQGAPGAPFAADPVLVGEHVLVVRADGSLARIRAEDGGQDGGTRLARPVVAAWAAGAGLAGLTAGESWTWDGAALRVEALPEPAIGGGPGVAVGGFGKVWIRGASAWEEAGRLDPRPQAGAGIAALLWSGQAVVAHGRHLAVLGRNPFRIDAGSDLLEPALWDGALVAASLEGRIWVWKP